MDIERILATLSETRPIFHSEADFQHALAWQIHISNCNIRLELPIAIHDNSVHLDIWYSTIQQSVALELKYKTKFLQACYRGEQFNLTNQDARDQACYDFIKDITRLEKVKERRPDIEAYAVFITNDSLYWRSAEGEDTVDANFRLDDGRILNGAHLWGLNAATGTTNGRETPLVLTGNYQLSWKDYSNLGEERNSLFRFLLVEV